MRKKLDSIELNAFDMILSKIFKRYTYKIYSIGMQEGYNWRSKLYKWQKKNEDVIDKYKFL